MSPECIGKNNNHDTTDNEMSCTILSLIALINFSDVESHILIRTGAVSKLPDKVLFLHFPGAGGTNFISTVRKSGIFRLPLECRKRGKCIQRL